MLSIRKNLMDSNAAATLVDQFHLILPSTQAGWLPTRVRGCKESPLRAWASRWLPAQRQTVVPDRTPDQTLLRAYSTRVAPIFDNG